MKKQNFNFFNGGLYIVSNLDTTYRFINGYDRLCMDIAGGSTAASADVQVYPYEGTPDQKWTLTKIS